MILDVVVQVCYLLVATYPTPTYMNATYLQDRNLSYP